MSILAQPKGSETFFSKVWPFHVLAALVFISIQKTTNIDNKQLPCKLRTIRQTHNLASLHLLVYLSREWRDKQNTAFILVELVNDYWQKPLNTKDPAGLNLESNMKNNGMKPSIINIIGSTKAMYDTINLKGESSFFTQNEHITMPHALIFCFILMLLIQLKGQFSSRKIYLKLKKTMWMSKNRYLV